MAAKSADDSSDSDSSDDNSGADSYVDSDGDGQRQSAAAVNKFNPQNGTGQLQPLKRIQMMVGFSTSCC